MVPFPGHLSVEQMEICMRKRRWKETRFQWDLLTHLEQDDDGKERKGRKKKKKMSEF